MIILLGLNVRRHQNKRINPVIPESSIAGQLRSPCDHKPAGAFTPPGHACINARGWANGRLLCDD